MEKIDIYLSDRNKKIDLNYIKNLINEGADVVKVIEKFNISGDVIVHGKSIHHCIMGKVHADDDYPAIIEAKGVLIWCKDGEIHRDDDKPAIVDIKGANVWYKHGKIHRDNDKPAMIYSDGTEAWYQHGVRFRLNSKPDIVYNQANNYKISNYVDLDNINNLIEAGADVRLLAEIFCLTGEFRDINGCVYQFFKGVLHDDSDFPSLIKADGSRCWYKNGQLHRENDKPAVIQKDGTKIWYCRGVIHRDKKPAKILPDKTELFFNNGDIVF